ncbi:hypothetical protein GO998_13165 [Ralstonia syzygii]|uniref:Transmembrane protein n=1 Tax=Ralstonia syzygii TaxID=28097 RepID=A0ABX7ZGP3_9RALS|nr:hypothetical protein [Ralstonia syzygii]QUP54615.1 hypothetical protein GO998_13165 [Ralstonia syzygii]
MSSADLDHLLRDANLIAWYAARHGKLPDGSQIFSLIESVKTDGPDDPKNVADLCMEMNLATKEIGRITVSFLIQRWSLLDVLRQIFVTLTPLFFGFLTLLLTLYLAFQSSQLTKADTAIREYQEWANHQPREKLYAAWKMYHYEQVLNVKGPPLDQLDSYQKLVDEVKQAADKGSSVMNLLTQSSNVLYLPRFLEVHGTELTRRLVRELNSANGPLSDDVNQANLLEGKGFPESQCNDSAQQISGNKAATEGAQQQPVATAEYANNYDCFLKKQLQISDLTFSYPLTWDTIFSIRAKINLMVTWLLPGLYGLLGACVYLLREFMRRENGAPFAQKQIIGKLLQVLRVALGGLAGIIIGWFWIPTDTSSNGTVVATISSIPFGLAFMAGFSIDTLFSLLERVRRMIDTG